MSQKIQISSTFGKCVHASEEFTAALLAEANAADRAAREIDDLASWLNVMQLPRSAPKIKAMALAVAMTLPIHRTERYL